MNKINIKQAVRNITPSTFRVITASLMTISCLTFGNVSPAYSQITPQVWSSIGSKDNNLSYAAGVKWAGFALEFGAGKEGVAGGDFLTFLPVPFVSPYAGLGVYSGDNTLAYSGGLHLYPSAHLFVGMGYHSIRGINGKIGFKF